MEEEKRSDLGIGMSYTVSAITMAVSESFLLPVNTQDESG